MRSINKQFHLKKKQREKKQKKIHSGEVGVLIKIKLVSLKSVQAYTHNNNNNKRRAQT